MEKQPDYIIVGQGIAGTVLAQILLEQGKTIVIIDDPSLSCASKVAAGVCNPVIFKRLVKSWRVDELLPAMESFYIHAENLLDEKFFFRKKIVKLFAEENEKEFWLKKANDEVGRYLSKTIEETFLPEIVNASLGAAEVEHAANLDTNKFLAAFKSYFQQQDCLLEEKFDYDQLIISENSVDYKGITASKVIFCEGYKGAENPYFRHLPFNLTKGEILTVKLPDHAVIPADKVINKGVFILPVGNNTFKVGATYEWDELNEIPTAQKRAELSDKLSKVLKVPFEIIGHEAGIRPTVNDRRPLIGFHPEHPAVAIFNGMGTKAVMLAPYFAKHFAEVLDNKATLDADVDISRF